MPDGRTPRGSPFREGVNSSLWLMSFDMKHINQPIIGNSIIIKFSILVDIVLSAFSVTYCFC